jgi:mono/diheme cytochrome c family protein
VNRISVLAILLSAFAAMPALATDDGLDRIARPFFAEHCVSCHGPKTAKGDFRADTLTLDYDSPRAMAHWEELMNRINSGDMPPKARPRPKPADVARVAEWVTGQLGEAEARRQVTAGERVAFRRLSRDEYANTIRDLLGVTFDAADPTGLPDDPDWHGFQRIGSVLTLSPAHVEKYLVAAEAILNEALPIGPQPKREVVRWGAFDLRGGSWKKYEKEYQARGIADKVRADIVPNNGALDDHTLHVKTTGDYFVRVKLSGLRPEGGRPPRLRLYDATIGRLLFERDVEAPEAAPVTIEFRTHLPAGNHNVRIMNAVPGPNPEDRRSRSSEVPNAFTGLKSRVPWQMKFTDDDGKPIVPFLLVDFIEWDGPVLASWPTPAYGQVFFGGESAARDLAYARQVVARFAERAWRRPVRPVEVDRLVALVEKMQKRGDPFEAAVKTALLAVLNAKGFLYLEEGSTTAPSPHLTDWELASRLSYFLWSSMPDQRLFDLAREGKLHQPDILRAEARRMLANPKAAAFAESFPRQWLQLRKVGMFAPDKTLYPEYDEYLEKSMIAETTSYFREVLARNASLREFLDSDWTMLNERLAVHYGIAGVTGEELRRVSLTPEQHRGGLLTHASVLSLTSDGTRHRPVHRGVWVLESIVNKPPPPPPANVPALGTPSAKERKTTVREKLEQHRADANCAGCHQRIDPLGLAFDNYDAIGRWRAVETVRNGTGADPRIDASGELIDGRKFADASGLKRLMLDDTDRFATAFAEKLATYTLRRGMTFGDRAELKRLVEQSKPNGYKLASFIEALVLSDLFRKR